MAVYMERPPSDDIEVAVYALAEYVDLMATGARWFTPEYPEFSPTVTVPIDPNNIRIDAWKSEGRRHTWFIAIRNISKAEYNLIPVIRVSAETGVIRNGKRELGNLLNSDRWREGGSPLSRYLTRAFTTVSPKHR